jgi:hypothetical protein
MFVVRYLALAALAVWVGGMVVLGALVAPSTLRVLQAADPAGGRVLAGLVFGEILQRFPLLAYACGAIVLVSLWVMKFVGPPPSWFVVRSAIVASMLAVALYVGMPVANELEGLRKQLAGSMHDVPDHDARRGRFEALHRRSAALMAVETGLGFFLLLWYVREGSL